MLQTLALASFLLAQPAGPATGSGSLEVPGSEARRPFAPRFAHAYAEGTGARRSTWLVLTEREPPLKAWTAAKDRAEARRLWSERERAAFLAVKLDAEGKVDLLFACPANGLVNTEMLSTWNGLDSVQVAFEVRDGRRLKGTLRTGSGACPGPDGRPVYCTATGAYGFDAPLEP